MSSPELGSTLRRRRSRAGGRLCPRGAPRSSITVSGTTANDGRGGALHPGDTGAQTAAALRQALSGGRRAWADARRRRADAHLPRPGRRLGAAAAVHADVFGDVSPANTMLFVHALIGEGFLVEVEVDAIVVEPAVHRLAPLVDPMADRRARGATSLRLNNDVPVDEFVELARLAESLQFDQIWVSNDLFFRSAPVLLAAAATATRDDRPRDVHPQSVLDSSGGDCDDRCNAAGAQCRALSARAGGGSRRLPRLGGNRSRGSAGPHPGGCRRHQGAVLRRLPRRRRRHRPWLAARRTPACPRRADSDLPRGDVATDAGADRGDRRRRTPPALPAGVVHRRDDPHRRRDSPDRDGSPTTSTSRRASGCRSTTTPSWLAGRWPRNSPTTAPRSHRRCWRGSASTRPHSANCARRPDRAVELLPPAMMELGVSGTPDEVVERCRHLIAAGARHVSFGPPLGPRSPNGGAPAR